MLTKEAPGPIIKNMDSQIPPVPPILPAPPVPPTPPVLPPAEKSRNWFKILLIIIGLLIILGLFGNIYLLLQKGNPKLISQPTPAPTQTVLLSTPTPDPTANWKIYNNAGISFKYPLDWVSEKFEMPGRAELHGLVQLMPENYKPDIPIMPLFIMYWDNPGDLTIEQYDKKINQGAAMLYPLYNRQAQITTLGGLTARYEQEGDCAPFGCHKYVVSAQNRIWEISSQYTNNPNEFKPIVEQILSTFQFLQ